MYYPSDPEEMTPEERLQEVAGILATGYLRLKKRLPYPADFIFEALTENRVDFSGNRSLNWTKG